MDGCRQSCHSLNATLLRDFITRGVCPYFGRLTELLTVHPELPLRKFKLVATHRWKREWGEAQSGKSPAIFQVKCDIRT